MIDPGARPHSDLGAECRDTDFMVGVGRQDFATALAADPGQGGLWLGFWDGGVVYFKDGQVRETYARPGGLAQGRVGGLYVDTEGVLWVATEGGLSG
jgi:ligand-binding sensor domain-containing protein